MRVKGDEGPTGPPTPVQPKSTVTIGASKPRQKKKTPVYQPSRSRGSSTSSGQRHSTSYSSNRNSSNYRNNSVQRRASSSDGGNKSVRKTTPVPPPKPTQKIITPVAPPKPPTVSSYLRSDSDYQRQLAGYAKALTDYQADQTGQRSQYDTGYANTKRDIGLAKQDALTSMENDYAARGLLRSSLYNTDVGKLNQEYQNQYTDLDKQRTAFLNQLATGLNSFRNEQSIQQQNAMAEAVRRRAEQYNL